MKNHLKKFYFICTNLTNSIISIISVLLFSSFRSNKMINQCSKKYKKFKDCIIMGNGPSLSSFLEKNLDELLDKNIIAVNFFSTTEYFERVRPSFYVLLDPSLFSNSLPVEFEAQIKELTSKLNSITWQMVLFIPSRFQDSLLVQQLNNNYLVVIPFNYTPISGFKSIENYFFKRNLGMPLPETVINASIFLAISLKFKSIHLYGVEQSWLKHLTVDSENKISVGLPHFYSGSDNTAENRSLSEFLFSQSKVFKSHMRLNEYAKHVGIQILNHTPGSYIDAYKRVIN